MSLKSASAPFKNMSSKDKLKKAGGFFSPTMGTANILGNIKTRYKADTAEPEVPGDSPATKALEARQLNDLAKLDEQESERIKRIKRGRIGAFTTNRSTLGGGGLVRRAGSGGGSSGSGGGGRTGAPAMGSGSIA